MNRRRALTLLSALPALSGALENATKPAAAQAPVRRNVPRGFESLPPVGLGTWLTFNIGDDAIQQEHRRLVLQRFFEAGGGMIDSSPMYGKAE